MGVTHVGHPLRVQPCVQSVIAEEMGGAGGEQLCQPELLEGCLPERGAPGVRVQVVEADELDFQPA